MQMWQDLRRLVQFRCVCGMLRERHFLVGDCCRMETGGILVAGWYHMILESWRFFRAGFRASRILAARLQRLRTMCLGHDQRRIQNRFHNIPDG